jgi:glyoxylate/hydroxypyruvate reductase A
MTPRDARLEVLLCGTMSGAEWAAWRQCLTEAAPAVRWLDLDAARTRPQAVRAAVVANPPAGSLAGWPGLELIQSLWAGVDRLLADPTVPPGVPLARMVDPAMTQAMAETALWAVLALHRGFFTYAHQQSLRRWHQHDQQRPREVPVLVLGAGQLGSAVGEVLRPLGYPVSCWRRSDGPAALGPLLQASRIVVNLLPLTPHTRGLVDERFLAAMPRGAGLVNLARGAHVVEPHLLAALDSGHLGHAVLDVFESEPLPAEHPFWRHPRVTVLPHVAALTDPRSASAVVAENLGRLVAGQPLLHLVDRQRGY